MRYLLLTFLLCAPCASWAHLSDTGQTIHYSTSPGEDADYLGVSPSFVFYASTSGNIGVDLNTGLVWSSSMTSGVLGSWETQLSYCDGLIFAERDDWRVPNLTEMLSIVNYDLVTSPAVYPGFSGFQNGWYWTSTRNMPVGYGFMVHMQWGVPGNTLLSSSGYVRCVRGPDSIQSEVLDVNIVSVSTTTAAQLNPGIWGYFTAGDVSFWFGVLVAIVVIVGFKAGGLR